MPGGAVGTMLGPSQPVVLPMKTAETSNTIDPWDFDSDTSDPPRSVERFREFSDDGPRQNRGMRRISPSATGLDPGSARDVAAIMPSTPDDVTTLRRA